MVGVLFLDRKPRQSTAFNSLNSTYLLHAEQYDPGITHWTAGLQYDRFRLSSFSTLKQHIICIVKSNWRHSHTVIQPPTVSVQWITQWP